MVTFTVCVNEAVQYAKKSILIHLFYLVTEGMGCVLCRTVLRYFLEKLIQ